MSKIKVTKIYYSSSLAGSHERGFQADTLAEACVTVYTANGTALPYGGLQIKQKKDGTGLFVTSPSQVNKLGVDENGKNINEYIPYFEIPRQLYGVVSKEVLKEYDNWVANDSPNVWPIPCADDTDELEDVFAI